MRTIVELQIVQHKITMVLHCITLHYTPFMTPTIDIHEATTHCHSDVFSQGE